MSLSQSDTYKPNFYAIIPADVRYCKNLEPSAKLLYGEITALANREGYCWASNQYFAETYEVEERTIRRWIESLKDNGFINVIIEKNGFVSSRKIYIFKEISTTGQKCPPDRTKMSQTEDKNALHNNTYNTIEEITTTPTPSKAAVVAVEKLSKSLANYLKVFSDDHGEKFKIPEHVISRLIQKHGGKFVTDQINHMVKLEQQAEKDENLSHKKKKTNRIDKPQSFLVISCKENWAMSINNKESL